MSHLPCDGLCEEQRKAEIMKDEIMEDEIMEAKIKMDGLKRWNSISDSVKREKLEKFRSEFMMHEDILHRDLMQMNIGHAKEELTNLRCFVLNALEELGIV